MKTKPLALSPPNPRIVMRPATLDDLDPLLADCWLDRTREVGRWLLKRMERSRADRRGTNTVVVAPTGALIGYGQVTVWPRCAEISDLVVSETYRSRGYGTAIIQHLMQYALELGVRCVEIGAAKSNPRAMALYHRLGFEDQRTILMNLGGPEREPVIYMQIRLEN